jgi:hypothetical protein
MTGANGSDPGIAPCDRVALIPAAAASLRAVVAVSLGPHNIRFTDVARPQPKAVGGLVRPAIEPSMYVGPMWQTPTGTDAGIRK